MGCGGSKRKGQKFGSQSSLSSVISLASLEKRESLGLSLSLAWIQEKNFEQKYDVVKVIGHGSIGEVSIVRRKSLGSSRHSAISNSSQRGFSFVDSISGGGSNDIIEVEGPAGESKEGMGSIPSLPKDYSFGTQDRQYAMKSIHVNRLSKSRVEEFENEVNILQRLHHPNIIQLREVFYYRKKIYMCMTLCTGGQLNHRSFTETQTCLVMSQVVRALVYMHETAKICHRDLKLENIMLESLDEPLVVKLIDFGLSKVFTEGDKMRTACGTVYTMAPEVMSGAGYSQKADLWSAGVIAFVLLCNNLPFLKDEEDLNDKVKVEQLAQARFYFSDPAWKTVSHEGKDFVRGLLKKQPGVRWTARDALDHCSQVWAPSLLRANDNNPCERKELTSLASAERNGSASNGQSIGPPGSPSRIPSAMPPSPPLSPGTPLSRASRLKAVHGLSIAKSMRRFADYGELKKAALMVTAFQLDRTEIKQLKDAFLEVDTKGNGAISLDELRTVLREHGVGSEEVDRVFGAVDMDRTGRLHYMEFLAATIEARGYIEEESLKEAFERLDVDSTGFISRNNLRVVLGKTYDNALIDKMLEEGDSSLSGSIEWEDFLVMMKPVVAQEYRKDTEAFLSETPAAQRKVAEVEQRAVDQTPSFAQTIGFEEGRASREASQALPTQLEDTASVEGAPGVAAPPQKPSGPTKRR